MNTTKHTHPSDQPKLTARQYRRMKMREAVYPACWAAAQRITDGWQRLKTHDIRHRITIAMIERFDAMSTRRQRKELRSGCPTLIRLIPEVEARLIREFVVEECMSMCTRLGRRFGAKFARPDEALDVAHNLLNCALQRFDTLTADQRSSRDETMQALKGAIGRAYRDRIGAQLLCELPDDSPEGEPVELSPLRRFRITMARPEPVPAELLARPVDQDLAMDIAERVASLDEPDRTICRMLMEGCRPWQIAEAVRLSRGQVCKRTKDLREHFFGFSAHS